MGRQRSRKEPDFELISLEGDVCGLLFRHEKSQKACSLFLEWLQTRNCEASKREVSQFARDLQAGRIAEDFTYRRSSFYRLILTRLIDHGFISLQTRAVFTEYNRVKGIIQVYAPIKQPIPKRGPPKGSFWHNAYAICKKWNEEFESN